MVQVVLAVVHTIKFVQFLLNQLILDMVELVVILLVVKVEVVHQVL